MKRINEFYPIIDVVGGTIILKDHFYMRIIEIFPLHFVLSEEDVKNDFIKKYKEFLKGIHIPIDITVVSREIEESEVLKYIKNIKGPRATGPGSKGSRSKSGEINLQKLYKDSFKIFYKQNKIYSQRFFITYKIKYPRKHLFFKKELDNIDNSLKIHDKQILFLLSKTPLRTKIINTRGEIINILSFI